MTKILNVFTAKGGVSSHYIPHITMSQVNCYYKKHYQVELGAYVQASQVNDPKNKNRPRTLDGIYLCPAPIFRVDIRFWTCGWDNLLQDQK